MNRVHNPLPGATHDLLHLWPLVHLVVELAERHRAAATRPAADGTNEHPADDLPMSGRHSEHGPHSPESEVSDG